MLLNKKTQMKFFLVLPAFILSLTLPAQAGNMFGPAPFRNGSPLVSGTDGIYQAVATAPNLTGLFSWAISGGSQTATAKDNKWIFFVDGQVITGSTVANVSEGKVSGILDSSTQTSLPTSADGTIELPIVFVIPGSAGAGTFQGKINLKSPVAAFNGEGVLQGSPRRVDQVVYINDLPDAFILENTTFDPVVVSPVLIPGSSLKETEFKFSGTRLSTSSSSQQGQGTQSNQGATPSN
jgi:hypothetical protein